MQTRTLVTIGLVVIIVLLIGVIGGAWTSTSLSPTVYP